MTGRVTVELGIATAAAGTFRSLAAALGRLDQPTPCYADPETWTSPGVDPEAAALAEQLCRRCPVLAECGQFADANHERSGIWAGRNRTPRPGRPAGRKEVPA